MAIPVGVPVAVPAADKNASKKVGQNDTTSKGTYMVDMIIRFEIRHVYFTHNPKSMTSAYLPKLTFLA